MARMKKKICDCYHTRTEAQYRYDELSRRTLTREVTIGVCYGTRECEPCKCGGDKSKCDFYKEKEENENI